MLFLKMLYLGEVVAVRGGIGWLAAGDVPKNLLQRVPFFVLRVFVIRIIGSLRISASYRIVDLKFFLESLEYFPTF